MSVWELTDTYSPTAIDIAPAVADHEAVCKIDIPFVCRVEEHAGFGFAAMAVVGIDVKAGFDVVAQRGIKQDAMHFIDGLPGLDAGPDVGLVGYDNDEQSA